MSGNPDVRLVHCVVCDDVRMESGGKEIIIGVYTLGMTVAFVPWFVTACLWLNVMWSGDGEVDIQVRVLNPRNEQVGETNAKFTAVWQGFQSTLTFRGLMVSADMEGIYDIQWKPDGREWESIRKFPIVIARS